jgi:hypothetical protein
MGGRVLLNQKIIDKVWQTFDSHNNGMRHRIPYLRDELIHFIEKNKDLFKYSKFYSKDDFFSDKTLRCALQRDRHYDNGAEEDMRNLLCQYAFNIDYTSTLEKIGTSVEIEKTENNKLKGINNASEKIDDKLKTFAIRIYIELTTRKAGIPIDEDNDVIEEIYNSWYKLFCTIRDEMKLIPIDCLKDIVDPKSIVGLANKLLNEVLRPHLTEHQAKFRKWLKTTEKDSINHFLSPQELQKKYPDYLNLIESFKETNKIVNEISQEFYGLVILNS